MNWSALTKKQQQMAIATAVLAVVQIIILGYFLGWTKPAASRGGSAKDELNELQAKLENARAFIRQEETIRTELDHSIAKLEELTVYAPTLSDRYAWSYEYVSRCAKLARVDLDSLEEVLLLKNDKKEAVDLPYEIRVSTRCGYNSLVELLWRLEKDNPLLRIKDVTINAERDDPQMHKVKIVIQWPSSVKIERGEK